MFATAAALAASAVAAVHAHDLASVEAELRASEPAAEVVREPVPRMVLEHATGARRRIEDLHGRVVLLHVAGDVWPADCAGDDDPLARVHALASDVPGLLAQLRLLRLAPGDAQTAHCAGTSREGVEPVRLLLAGRVQDAAGAATAWGFTPASRGGVAVVDAEGLLRARFHGNAFSPLALMLYAAALAHGEHEARSRTHGAAPRDLRALLAGGAFAGLGLLGYGLARRARRRRGSQ